MRHDYFVILAEMRTGSNYLEASLNSFDDLRCHGELFNPIFVGHHNKDEAFGVGLSDREDDPLRLIELMKSETAGTGGFRLFSDHDPRVLKYVLSDPSCAKIVLTRNPLDSYVSLKIAAATDQWRLADASRRRDATITFDDSEFRAQLSGKRDFQLQIQQALQRSGQTAFYLAYEDLSDVEVINGLARFIGSEGQISRTAKATKKQNPDRLEDKVMNFTEMVEALASIDHFALSKTPNFEPRRGPNVPGFYVGTNAPLMYMPIPGGPVEASLVWMAGVDGQSVEDLQTGLTQKALRQWKKSNPGHRSFTILRHPLERAYHVFTTLIPPNTDETLRDARRVMRSKYEVDLPTQGNSDGATAEQFRESLIAFLKFLKFNLAGQTSIRIDPAWATQTAILSAAAEIALPDRVIREQNARVELAELARDVGLETVGWQKEEAVRLFPLAEVYDAQLEKACYQTYRRDYINFGFAEWQS